MTKLFLDTNIIFDAVLNREKFSEEADAILALSLKEDYSLYILALTIPNFHYVAKKVYKEQKLRNIIKIIDGKCTTIPLTIELIRAALDSNFKDYEDALQHKAALQVEADFIITRNLKDFKESKVPVYEPVTFLDRLEQN